MTCRTLEDYYHVESNTLERQYKDVLSGYRTWSEFDHADEWLVFPDNVGKNMAIDETSLSNGEIYTILTHRDRHGRERCLAAVVRGTRSEDVINALEHIPEDILGTVEEVLWTQNEHHSEVKYSSSHQDECELLTHHNHHDQRRLYL